MKKWVVRFVSLLAFNIVVLLVIGWLSPARVGWAAIPAGFVLTLLVLFVKPLVHRMGSGLAGQAPRTGNETKRRSLGEWGVSTVVTLGVALVVWILTVMFTGVRAGYGFWGFLWSYVIPPIILTISWAIYAAINQKVEAKAGEIYDHATGGRRAASGSTAAPTIPQAPSSNQQAGRRELNDGLTDEQRKLFDSL